MRLLEAQRCRPMALSALAALRACSCRERHGLLAENFVARRLRSVAAEKIITDSMTITSADAINLRKI